MTSIPPSGSTSDPAGRERRPSLSILVLSVGLMAFSALRIVWLAARHDPQVHVPAPVAYTLAFVMLSGSTMALLKVLGHGEHMDWLAVPLMLGMTVTFGWVGLYGDPRYCSSSGPLLLPMPSCHTAFTGAAVLMLLMTWLAARTWWRRWRLASRRPPDAA